MKHIRALMTGVSVFALVAFLATPTFATKAVMEEEEMDEVTAAGQPKIAQAHVVGKGKGRNGKVCDGCPEEDPGDALAVNFQVNVFAAHLGGQEFLTALTLNNIFGENQIANNINIQAANSDFGSNSGAQTNNALQSWGSAKAWSSATAYGADGGAANCEAFGLIAKCNANGGDASEAKIALLWEFADEIADASNSGRGDAIAANVVVTIIAGTFDEFAQSELTALTVNNVFGFNQVVNGLNISGGDIIGTGIDGAGVGTTTNQNNTSAQWRGAPGGWNGAPTFF